MVIQSKKCIYVQVIKTNQMLGEKATRAVYMYLNFNAPSQGISINRDTKLETA
jgi:hypothetical protein